MIKGAELQALPNLVIDRQCKDCDSHVTIYSCIGVITALRPGSDFWSSWASCDNENCENHFGEGLFPLDKPDWIYRK